MTRQRQLLAFLAMLALVFSSFGMTPEQRKTYLDKLLQTLPALPSFNSWLDQTKELPPDFDALPKINGLPDPVHFLNGRPVNNADDWKIRRAEIFSLEQKYDIGTFPPKP